MLKKFFMFTWWTFTIGLWLKILMDIYCAFIGSTPYGESQKITLILGTLVAGISGLILEYKDKINKE